MQPADRSPALSPACSPGSSGCSGSSTPTQIVGERGIAGERGSVKNEVASLEPAVPVANQINVLLGEVVTLLPQVSTPALCTLTSWVDR
jgi:hypothetical protein